jgi:hypothetical protein
LRRQHITEAGLIACSNRAFFFAHIIRRTYDICSALDRFTISVKSHPQNLRTTRLSA